MLRSLSFRRRLVLSVALPLGVLAIVSGLAAITARTGSAAQAQSVLSAISLMAIATAVVASVIAMLVVRSTTKPLNQLTEAAQRLADEQLPALVEGLKGSGTDDLRYLSAAIRPIEVRSNDELGALVRAFNAVQTVAVDVAAEQAELLRRGIGDMFVSLARRNQVLIDRQIEFLDELEATAEDQDQLTQLYRLDHLATRMRRNAESLLVLAGVEPNRRRTRPVALLDVARAAVGETEDYSRVDVVGFEDVEVLGEAAVDLGHLLAELLENATAFSPPESRVTVAGGRARNGYTITIADSGVGMTGAQLDEANALIASPPPVGLALSRSLGFTVVARLAARHNVGVQLATGDDGGLVATLQLPSHLLVLLDTVVDGPAITHEEWGLEDLVDEREIVDVDALPELDDDDPFNAMTDEQFEEAFQRAWGGETSGVDADRHADEEAWRVDDVDASDVADVADEADDAEGDEIVPATLEEAVPLGAAFDAGLATLMEGDDAVVPPTLVEPPIALPDGLAVHLDPVTMAPWSVARPVEPAVAGAGLTASGLVRRIPQATRLAEPGASDDARPAVARSRRSPDDVRAMLAQYRNGMEQGRSGAEEREIDG